MDTKEEFKTKFLHLIQDIVAKNTKNNIKDSVIEILEMYEKSVDGLELMKKEKDKWFDIAYRDGTKLDLVCEKRNELQKQVVELQGFKSIVDDMLSILSSNYGDEEAGIYFKQRMKHYEQQLLIKEEKKENKTANPEDMGLVY